MIKRNVLSVCSLLVVFTMLVGCSKDASDIRDTEKNYVSSYGNAVNDNKNTDLGNQESDNVGGIKPLDSDLDNIGEDLGGSTASGGDSASGDEVSGDVTEPSGEDLGGSTASGGDSASDDEVSGDVTEPNGGTENGGVTPSEGDGGTDGVQADTPTSEPQLAEVGTDIGDLCPTFDLTNIYGNTVNTEQFLGKVVVINVWGTWCSPCRTELPYFDRIASEYSDDVVVLAVHSSYNNAVLRSYVSSYFPVTRIIFAYDTALDEYYSLIGGTVYYPRTVILDKNGVITYADDGAVSYEFLANQVELAGAEK